MGMQCAVQVGGQCDALAREKLTKLRKKEELFFSNRERVNAG